MLSEGRKPVYCGRKAVWLGTPERFTLRSWRQFQSAQDGHVLPAECSDEFVADLISQLSRTDLAIGSLATVEEQPSAEGAEAEMEMRPTANASDSD